MNDLQDDEFFLSAELPALQKHCACLAVDIEDALDTAAALENATPGAPGNLPYYAQWYFPDDADFRLREFQREACDAWSEIYGEQVGWEIELLRLQRQKPAVRRLRAAFAAAAPWTRADDRDHRRAVAKTIRECREGLNVLHDKGYDVCDLHAKLDTVLKEDPDRPLAHISTLPRYIAFMDMHLRRTFAALAQNADTIVETCRSDMAEDWIVYRRRAPRAQGDTLRWLLQTWREHGAFYRRKLETAGHRQEQAQESLHELSGITRAAEINLSAFRPQQAVAYLQ